MEINSNTMEIAGVIAALGGQWALIQYRLNRNDKENDKSTENIWAEMNKLRAYWTQHEKDSSETRLGIEKQFGVMALTINDTTSKFKFIMEQLEEIKKKISDFDERSHGNR